MTRRWAAGAKLNRLLVDLLRAAGQKARTRDAFVAFYARAYGMHPRSIQRVIDGKTWTGGIMGAKLPEEYKTCPVCGVVFPRSWPNGRRRSDKFWAQKRACTNSCNVRMLWREGRFADRRHTGRKKT